MEDQKEAQEQNGGLYGALAGAWNYAASSISRCLRSKFVQLYAASMVDEETSVYFLCYNLCVVIARTIKRLGGHKLLKTLHLVIPRRPAERLMADPVETL